MTQSFFPPHVSDAVLRPRLFSLLDKHAQRQNFFVTGQAAQGKSTLVASYIGYAGKKALWFHLTTDDNQDVNLFEKIVKGIQIYSRGAGEVFFPMSTLGTDKGVSRLTRELSLLLRTISFPLVLVLDDAEFIDPGSSGFVLLDGLLNTRFDGLRFFVLSRRVLPFSVSRLKTEHPGFFLGNEELAFTLEETRAYFLKQSDADVPEIEKIHRITDGWAGGLTLILESVRQFRGLTTLPERVSSEVFDYFSQEIYKTLSDPIREFLMVTSILDIIDLDVVTHMVEIDDGLKILTDLEKRNLFIQRIDAHDKGPGFKYHHLFRDFLNQQLTRTKGEAALKTLNLKAGRYFWKNKDHEQAMDFLCKAGAYPEVIHILKIKGTDYIIGERMSGLEKWIACLPDDLIDQDPWLIFFRTITRRIRGGKKNIKAFEKALSMFEAISDIRGILLSVGYLIEAAVFIREPSSRILKWIDKAETYLGQVSEKDYFPWARALLWQQIGLGYIAGDGNIPKGISACRNAILLGHQIKDADLVRHASITMTFGYVQAGDFAKAGKMLAKIKNIAWQGQHPEFKALKNIVDIDLALKNGRFEDAGHLLIQSEQDIETFGLIFLYPGFIEAGALYRVYTGQYDDALRMADHLSDFSILEGNDFYKGISHRIKALSFLKQGRCPDAAREIHRALDALDQTRKGDIHHYLTRQLAGIIALEQGAPVQAEAFLGPCLIYFERIASDLSFVETCMALGLSAWMRKDFEKTGDYLEQGFRKASQEGYSFFPLISEPLFVRAFVVWTAFNGPIRPDTYLSCLTLRCDADRILGEMDRVPVLVKPGDKARIIENLRPLYKHLLPGIRIETLGRFTILCGHKVLDSRNFEGIRPLLLLKSIVRHGSRDIPKEILIDDLWPQADPAAGEKNFKINLHRLRKAIEPHAKKEFGYSYVVQKAGLISFDSELVRLDVDEFLALSLQGAEHERVNRFEAALECYEKAAALYKGDYFSEEPYLEWISRKRDLLKGKYIEVLEKKARLHEELDQIQKAVETWQLVLDIEPYFEAAYQNLMILYADSGRKNRAMEVFEACLVLFQNELGTDPDEETFHIYEKIKSR